MAIQAQCEHCGFRYGAPDKLAGKRVRCKRCGQVFAIPGATVTAAGGEDWEASLQNIEETASQLTASGTTAGTRPKPPQPRGDEDVDSVLSGAHSAEGMSASEAIRSTQQFDFPYSKEVDRFLPPALVVLSLLILVFQTFGADDLRELNRAWVPFARLAMVMLLYVVVVWPLSHLGVKKGVQAQRAHMPWSPVWKSFAVFTFPFALGYTLWLVGNNIPSLLLGCIAGLLVGMAALWLLYRVRLDRGAQPLIYSAVLFLLSIVLSAGFVFGINHTVNAITLGSRTAHEYASSPILPGLAWDSTAPPPADEPLTEEPKPKAVASTQGTTTQPVSPATQERSPEVAGVPPRELPPAPPAPPDRVPPPAPPALEVVEPLPPAPGVTGAVPPTPGLFDNVPQPPRVIRPENVPPPEIKPEAKPLIAPSEFVRAVNPTPVEPGFDRVIYPLAPGEHLLVVRTRGEDRFVERWHAPTWKSTGQRKARPEPTSREPFALSADGATLASIVNWPTLSVQLWGFDDGRVTQVIELNRENGVPSLVGFVSPTQFIVHWQREAGQGLEVFDLRNPRPTRLDLTGVDTLEHNYALSPDGRTFAIAGRTPQGPAVGLYPVGAQRPSRLLPIKLLDAQWGVKPSGLAFAPDGLALAALFEQEGNALISGWRIPVGKEFPPLLYPAGALSPAPEKPTGGLFAWIPNTGACLIHGTDIVEMATGKVLGQTGFSTARSQHLTAAGEAHIVHTDEAGQTRLVHVLFDPTKLPPAKP